MTNCSFSLKPCWILKVEFQGEGWEWKRSKYENILDVKLKQYPKGQGKYSDKEKLNRYRVAAKLKLDRTGYRKAYDNGRRSSGGRTVFTFHGIC